MEDRDDQSAWNKHFVVSKKKNLRTYLLSSNDDDDDDINLYHMNGQVDASETELFTVIFL